MNQGKVTLIVHGDQIVIILIHLHGGELTFVHNVSVAERTDIEPGLPSSVMRDGLSEDIELSLEFEEINSDHSCDLLSGYLLWIS